jgi:hypothetical protein
VPDIRGHASGPDRIEQDHQRDGNTGGAELPCRRDRRSASERMAGEDDRAHTGGIVARGFRGDRVGRLVAIDRCGNARCANLAAIASRPTETLNMPRIRYTSRTLPMPRQPSRTRTASQ